MTLMFHHGPMREYRKGDSQLIQSKEKSHRFRFRRSLRGICLGVRLEGKIKCCLAVNQNASTVGETMSTKLLSF